MSALGQKRIAGRYPEAKLAPIGDLSRARLQQWLCFIGTELHKAMFIPLFDKTVPDGTRTHTLAKSQSRLDFLNRHLTGREFLLDRFSVADAYLCTVLNWTKPTQIDLSPWPAIDEYHRRIASRASVARAISEEYALYQTELARHRTN